MQSVIDLWVDVVVGFCSAFGHHLKVPKNCLSFKIASIMQSVIDLWVDVVVGFCSAFGHHLTATVDHCPWDWAEQVYFARPITPHAERAPAFPVAFDSS